MSDLKNWREIYQKQKEREVSFVTVSGVPVEPLYTPDSCAVNYEDDLGHPGQYPFTRGVRNNMYRGRLWTMRH